MTGNRGNTPPSSAVVTVDRAFRVRFQQWMNTLWQQKDEDLARLLGE